MAEEAAFELSRAVAEIEGLLAGKNARLADLESAKRSLREELDQLDRQQVKDTARLAQLRLQTAQAEAQMHAKELQVPDVLTQLEETTRLKTSLAQLELAGSEASHTMQREVSSMDRFQSLVNKSLLYGAGVEDAQAQLDKACGALKAAEQAAQAEHLQARSVQLSQDLAGCTASWAHVTASLHSSRQDLAAKQAYLQGLQEQLRQDSLNQEQLQALTSKAAALERQKAVVQQKLVAARQARARGRSQRAQRTSVVDRDLEAARNLMLSLLA